MAEKGIFGPITRLRLTDVNSATQLSTAAGWNQVPEDWIDLLTLGTGFGVFTPAGRLIATSVALPYPPDFGWVSMVLVEQSFQRRGLGARMLCAARDHLSATSLVPFLDATPAGRMVYRNLGFLDVASLTRWEGTGTGALDTNDHQTTNTISAISDLDRVAFGADRLHLLNAIIRRTESKLVVGKGGFVITRRGRTATHIGPLVATSVEAAIHLLQAARERIAGQAIADIPDQIGFDAGLLAAGFFRSRPFTRMANGGLRSFGKIGSVFAAAGPDLG